MTDTDHIILPAKLEWKSRCVMHRFPANDMEFSLKELIDAKLLKQNGPYQTGGWIHPSNLTTCLRATYYDLIDAPGERLEHIRDIKLAQVGNALHRQIQEWAAEVLGAEFVS